MIEIKNGLINIDRDSLLGVPKYKWAIPALHGPHFRIYLLSDKEKGAVRVRWYKTGAQIQAQDFLEKEGVTDGKFNTLTRKSTISINLDKGL